MRAADIMTREVEVVRPEDSLQKAAMLMDKINVGFLPVSNGERVVGVITDRDIAVRAVAEGLDGNAKVRDVMSDGIRWCYEDEPVERVAQIMSEHQIRRLPIVNRDKRLVGIVALGDLAVKERETAPATEALCEISEPA